MLKAWPAGLALILALAGCTPSSKAPEATIIRFQAVPLQKSDVARRNVGALRFLGGWKLTSNNRVFGGVSSMAVEGRHFILLSDSSVVIRFDWLGGDQAIQPSIFALPTDEPGLKASSRRQGYDRDSESMTVEPSTGRILVGFEGTNQIRRYAPAFATLEASAAPALMQNWPSNNGAESLVTLRDGRVLVLAEDAGRPAAVRRGLLFDHDPTSPGAQATAFRYRSPVYFKPTDAAQLPDGRVLVLNRHFSLLRGFEAALTIIDPSDIRPNVILRATELARLAWPLTVDNMEALAVVQDAGQTVLWMASDDNHSVLQRTLLMKFALDLPPAGAGGQRPRP